MKTPLIVANWKANKTVEEAEEWLTTIQNSEFRIQNSTEVVVCAPYVDLLVLKEQFSILNSQFSIHLGAQDISQFEDGAYTGEITGRMLKDLVEYVIIGHSERRKYFQETDDILKAKVEKALKFGLKPIYCLSETEMMIPQGVEIVAYEPLSAIGSGNPDSPENADLVAGKIKEKQTAKVLYGGSVKPANTQAFVQMENIDGLLIGGASLKAGDFLEIIKNAV